MTLSELREYCLKKSGAKEDFPFDDENLVYKVGGKMFLLTNIKRKELSMNLKCEPFLAELYRENFKNVTPGYHMNKKHWNTVAANGDVSDEKIYEMVDHSYNLVFNGLSKKIRDSIL